MTVSRHEDEPHDKENSMAADSSIYPGPPLARRHGTSVSLSSTASNGLWSANQISQPPPDDQLYTLDALLDPTAHYHHNHQHDALLSRPPPIGYTLSDKKLRIFLFWCSILFDCAIMPTVLYFVLWYEAGPGLDPPGSLSANTVLSIVTATIGGTAIFEWIMRCWKLWKKDSDCRVMNANSRWLFDWFQWWFGLCILLVVAELILGTAWSQPKRRLLALPLATVQVIFGIALLTLDILHLTPARTPFRISSVARGSPVPPGIYPLVEDICAVSGHGKTTFREALARRYAASPTFRRMLSCLSWFWAIGTLCSAAGTIYLVMELSDIDMAYAFGWTLPFAWAMIWSVLTFPYVYWMLAREERAWVNRNGGLA